jgi:long-subunit fatty acid transport protein
MFTSFWVPVLGVVLSVAASSSASGAPLLDSRVGGLGLVGPAIAHPASVFYNPAALVLLPPRDLGLYLDGTLRYAGGSIALRSTDRATGAPLQDSVAARQDLQEALPQFFLAIYSTLGTDSIVASISLHTPFLTSTSFLRDSAVRPFDGAAQGPARYHAVDLTLLHLFATASFAIRLADVFSFGGSVSYVFGFLDFGFARDVASEGGTTRDRGEYAALDDCGNGSPCGYGSDAAAEAVRVRGTANAVGYSFGAVGRPHPRVTIGLGYVSRVVANLAGDAWVYRAQGVFDNAKQDSALSSSVQRDPQGRAAVSYSLPDMVHLGVSWQTTPKLLLALQFHWIDFSLHRVLDIRLTGTQLRSQPEVPDRVVQYRGFQDVYGVELGAEYQLRPSLGLQVGSLVETSAVPTEAVSPKSIDGVTVDSFVALRFKMSRGWTIRAGYGLVLMPQVTVQSSVFSPSDMVSCVEAHYDVDLPECKRAAGGQGLASAAGSYRLMTHRLGLSLGYELW